MGRLAACEKRVAETAAQVESCEVRAKDAAARADASDNDDRHP